MFNLTDMLWIETRKAIRSRVPLFTSLGFMMLPLAGAFFMIILKDPEFARKVGLISAKANLLGNTADWPTYFSFFSQGTAVGGFMLSSVIVSWVFGREFADGTLKDMLAVPVPRSSILLAKFIIVSIWYVLMAILIVAAGLALGGLIGLPGGSGEVFVRGIITTAVTALLVTGVVPPIAFFASFGRGYLPSIGVTLLLVALANIIAIIGWGDYFPWSIPAVYAASGGGPASPGPVSYLIVIITGLAGIGGTYWWWKTADQNR